MEASRTVADRNKREFFLMLLEQGALVAGGGLPHDGPMVADGDIEVLAAAGLLRIIEDGQGSTRFRVTPEGERFYAAMKTRAGEPVREVEDDVRGYLDSEPFRSRYGAAYQSFAEAERMLWGRDSQKQLTAVGHHAREALQAFATGLVERHQPPAVNSNPTHTLDRLSAVVQMHRPTLGDRRTDFLDALFGYWREVVNIAQRQEHGGQKEGESLVWEDARRVVLHTAVVIVEVARTLDPLAP
ncbi:MAG: hypothetical protein H0T96_07510 [Thermoleophilaceae bacterium]|nr:hypothetical protein [Thermoleophilaceae bacterium]